MTPPREFHRLRVAEVVTEAGGACSVVLDVPPDLAGAFGYRPGQFLTVRVPSDRDGSVARCYSLSSSPHTGDRPTITVKRTDGGYASNWLADNLAAGSMLDTLPPAGTFCPESLDGDFLLFAAGSGITPVISILKSALARGSGRIVLSYANRDERSVIFDAELRRLADAAGDRLAVAHWLDSVQGPPTAAALAALARPYAGYETFICGPDPYLAVVRDALGRLGVPPRRGAHRAVPVAGREPVRGDRGAGRRAGRHAGGHPGRGEAGAALATGQPDAGRADRAGLDAPYSCRQGICGACACQLTGGEVDMAHNEVLEAEDLADGYILACQAVPLTESVSITY